MPFYDDLRDEMKSIFMFWIEECNIDGYRCDVADRVPTDFWEEARENLDSIKSVFMLAEAENPDHHKKAFNMSYAWELHHILNSIVKGEKDANAIKVYFAKNDTTFPENSYRMSFITNHDENSWNGTVEERMGEAGNLMAVLSYTLPGMPLIYSGQETGLSKRLKFFEKDTIIWNPDSPLNDFYKTLNQLKSDNKALWNGDLGGDMQRVTTSNDSTVFAFLRKKEGNRIFTIANLSAAPVSFSFIGKEYSGNFVDAFNGNEKTFISNQEMELAPWEYLVYISK